MSFVLQFRSPTPSKITLRISQKGTSRSSVQTIHVVPAGSLLAKGQGVKQKKYTHNKSDFILWLEDGREVIEIHRNCAAT